jgi:hypothetical protein
VLTLLLLLPWTVRNYRAFGTLSLWPNTNSGFALFWSNHPIYGTRFETVLSKEHGVSYPDLIPPDLRHLNEAQLDQALRAQGLRFILDDPGRYVLLSLSRIPVQFQFWPTADSSSFANLARLLSFGIALPLFVLGAVLFLWQRTPHTLERRFWQRDVPWTATDRQVAGSWLMLGIIVTYNALHVLTWAKVRYRLPTDAFMLLFAALALVWAWERWRNRSKQYQLLGTAEQVTFACPKRVLMRIVYILLSPTFGMHQYTADLANRLATDEAWLEAEVHLVTTTNLPADRYAPAVRIHTPLTTQNTGLSLDSLRLDKLARVKATLRELRPDLVHFTGPHLWNVVLLRWLRRQGIPTIHTLHDLDPHAGGAYGWFLPRWNQR